MSAAGWQTTGCPSWYASDGACGGEHQGPVSSPVYATVDLPTFIPEVGAVFPAITTALSWDTISGSEPGIWMYVQRSSCDGTSHDLDVYLRPHEVRQLVDDLQARLDVLQLQALEGD